MSYPAPFYAALHRGTPGDLDHYLRICQGASTVLELGCGHGRVVCALASAGFEVVGLEQDPGLLAMARHAVEQLPAVARARVELREGDMTNARLERRFDRVLVPFGGLYCLLDDHQLHAALHTAALHLHPEGRLAFDVYAADDFHAYADPDDVPDDAHTPLARVTVDGVDYEVLERSTWDKSRQRIDASYLYVDEQGRTVEGTIEQRYLLIPQLRAALSKAGLEVEHLGHGFDASASPPADLDDDEREDDGQLVVVARFTDERRRGE